MLSLYSCAIKTVQTKFDVINTEYKIRHRRNPIHSISSRMKKSSSIIEKLQRNNVPVSVENIRLFIHDVAGIRVICFYLDDVYDVAEMILAQRDVTLIKQKDYISEPKHNGYRSLHLILSVPIYFSGQIEQVETEVQIRTIAMDFWASLEHRLKYKKDITEESNIIERLRICAETIAKTDTDMLQIRRSIEKYADIPTEDEILFENLRNIDISI